MTTLKKVAIDLVPMLPGATNGGAKIFILELIDTLSTIAPEVQFLLLTRRSSHDELARLDRSNLKRKLVWDDTNGESAPSGASLGKIAAGTSLIRMTVEKKVRAFLARLLLRVRHLLVEIRRRAPQRASAGTDADTVADLLFCPFTGSTFFDLPMPTVVVIYDLQYQTYPQFFTSAENAERDLNFRSSSQKSALVTISEFVRSTVIAHQFVDKAAVFPIHIRTAKRLPRIEPRQRDLILQNLGLQCENYLLYPANFWQHKNHEMLLTAFAMARQSGLPAGMKLICTGAPGPRMQAVSAAAKALGVHHCVLFPGFLTDIEFAAVLGSCIGVIYPSLYEGFGMPILEAMAAGCPVACGDRTSLPEVAGGAALLFDPRKPRDVADAMVRIALDPQLRADLIERGDRRAQAFCDSKEMAHQYLTVFKFALATWQKSNNLARMAGRVALST